MGAHSMEGSLGSLQAALESPWADVRQGAPRVTGSQQGWVWKHHGVKGPRRQGRVGMPVGGRVFGQVPTLSLGLEMLQRARLGGRRAALALWLPKAQGAHLTPRGVDDGHQGADQAGGRGRVYAGV